MADHNIFPDDLVVGRSRNGKFKFAIVDHVAGIEDSDESSDSEFEDFDRNDLQQGFVRVTWYPDGKNEVIEESQLQLVDRSCLPRDVVRMKGGNQLGTVISTQVLCDVTILGTSKILKGINITELKPIIPFGPGDHVTLGPWLGRIRSTREHLLLRFPNGARGRLDAAVRDGFDMLRDIYPQPSDEGGFVEDPFYPGQYLSGTEKAFTDIEWLTEQHVKFKAKTRYRVLVEQIELTGIEVKWGSRGFLEEEEGKTVVGVSVKKEEESEDCGSSVDPEPYNAEVEMKLKSNPAEPPPSTIEKEDLQKVRLLKHFLYGHTCVSDRLRYQLSEEDAEKLNKQKNKTMKKTKRLKLAKRMEQKFLQGSNLSSTSIARKSGKGRRKQENTAQHDSSESSSENDDSAYDEDETVEMEDEESTPSPSSGACASVAQDENDIEVTVNAESDINIPSPAGQRPTILGILSCRVGPAPPPRPLIISVFTPACLVQDSFLDRTLLKTPEITFYSFYFVTCCSTSKVAGFELDFSLIQEVAGVIAKRKFHCNIQNPECTREEIDKMSAKFLAFMKGMLKKNKDLLNTKSCAAVMSQCPHAIRTFMLQQSSLSDQEIMFEYQTGGKRTSGIIDKDGKKVEVEYADAELDFITPPNPQGQLPKDPQDHENALTVGPPAKKQAGPNVHFHAGQWISVEVTRTRTTGDIQWQDGTIDRNIVTSKLFPAHHVDDNDFCPGDFVIDKRAPERKEYYGIVLKADSHNRMAKIQWIENGEATVVEEVSVYEVADHEQLHFRISDLIVRISNLHSSDSAKQPLNENQLIGELLRVTELGMLQVVWADASVSLVHPRDVMSICEENDSLFDSSDDEFEEFDDSSWVTASSESNSENRPSSEPSNMGDNNDSPPTNLDPHPVSMEGAGEGSNVNQEPELNEPNDGEANDESEESNIEMVNAVDDVGEENNPGDSDTDLAGKEQDLDPDIEDPDKDPNIEVRQGENIKHVAAGPSVEPLETTQMKSSDSEADTSITANISASDASLQIDSESSTSSSFFMESTAPPSHHFIKRSSLQSPPKIFLKAAQRDIKLLRTSLSPGIVVKAYEDRLDLLSVLIEGPDRTPYQDGIFAFDVYLPQDYPTAPPSVHYVSYSPRLNPNLYEAGRVCVSLLGTWSGKGSERWTKGSSLLQVLLSIQGLILNSEPYYNEAGYEGHRGTVEGRKNSRCYNEMVILRLVQHMTSLLHNPPAAFDKEIKSFCSNHLALLHNRVSSLIEKSNTRTDGKPNVVEQESDTAAEVGFPLLPLSKGVILSLKGRLDDLETACKAAGFMSNN